MKWRKLIRGLFLLLFLGLLAMGRIKIWMGLFLMGMAGAFISGRFYCGWICPTLTVTEALDRYYEKRGIRRPGAPEWVKRPVIRIFALAALVMLMVFTLRSGKDIPVLAVSTFLGIALSFFFKADLWHRYLCPYGILLSMPARFQRKFMKVKEEGCVQCARCVKICPVDAISLADIDSIPEIDKSLCLKCGACEEGCPVKAIG